LSKIKNVSDVTSREFLTIHETTQELACGDSTVRDMIQLGQLPAVKIGRVYRIPRAVLNALAEKALAQL